MLYELIEVSSLNQLIGLHCRLSEMKLLILNTILLKEETFVFVYSIALITIVITTKWREIVSFA